MMEENKIKIDCIEITQPIGTFYIGSIDSADLVQISYADVRTIEQRDVEVLSGIERPLSLKRVAELRKYVTNIDASFPTGIILAVGSEHAEYDPKTRTMRIDKEESVAKIIDGQHRIDGLKGYSGPKFQLNVTLFVDMDLEDQALLFATINLKQTPVGKSLAYDLFEFAKTRSPQKTCHNIAKLLNAREGSPFFRRVMILGVATGQPTETITQAAFIDRLIVYVSTDAMGDRDAIKRGQKLSRIDPAVIRVRKLIFRNMFIDERDAEIARVLWNYFSAVATRWPKAWQFKQPGLVLNRTTGFRALMRFLPLAYLSLGGLDTVVSEEDFRFTFDKVKLTDDDFTPENFVPGTSGQAKLFHTLEAHTRFDEHTTFNPIKKSGAVPSPKRS
jgi:DGQHR domain-containing protein